MGERDAPHFLVCVRRSSYGDRNWKFVQAKSKQAMKQVLRIRDEKTRMKVTPPLAVAPITQEV